MKVNERIKNRRVELGLSVDQLAEKLGINRATIYRYESEDISKLPATILQPLAAALRTTPHYLMGWEEAETLNTPADKAGKTAVSIPVLGSIPAGIPLEAIQDILDWEEITGEMANTGEYYALRIKGDSMEPKISEGDVVIIRRQEQVDNGEIAVVMINGDDATLKKFFANETGITLIGTNPAFIPLTFTREQVEQLPVRVIGKVVELRAKF